MKIINIYIYIYIWHCYMKYNMIFNLNVYKQVIISLLQMLIMGISLDRVGLDIII